MRESQFSCKVVVLTLCACVHTPQYILLVQRAAEPCPACHAVSDLSVVVVGLLWGLAGYWQHPSMGRRWQFPSCSLPSTPRYSPDLKWHKQQITRVRQQGKKSHITQWRLGWTNSSLAAWGYSTQTWRAVSHGPVWAGLGSCRQHVSAQEFENKHHWYAFNNRQVCSCKHHYLQSRTLERLSSRFHTNAHSLLLKTVK